MVTIILPVSRTTYLRAIFNCLAELEKPADTELVIITDGTKDLERAVDRRLDSISFTRIQVVSFGDSPAEDINNRRYRISAIHNKARHYIPDHCDQVFVYEDDTVIPKETLTKLLKSYKSMENCAFVQGVQLGRHNSSYIGSWRADSVVNPTEITSILPGEGLEPIDAGGLYCALIDADLYKMHHFQPFDTQGTNGLSCDVNLGLYLRQQGYGCYIDWSVETDHIGERGSVNMGNTTPVQVQFKKEGNKWRCETL